MHVAEMQVIPVAHREPPLRNSWGAHSELAARTIVRLVTADGTVGVAETYADDRVIDALERARSLVEGRNVYELRPLELRLQDPMAYGAVDTAIHDLLGKAVGEPVYNLLGGKVRDEVEFSGYLFYKYADSDPDGAAIAPEEVMTPEAMVGEARQFVDAHGFRVLKLKGGVLPPDEELKTLELLAEEFGSDTPLRIDPNGTWSVETAIDVATRLRDSDLNIEFLEDPVANLHAHARLKRHVDYPVATNMYVTEFDHIAPAVEMDAVDVILSDHHYWGGLTGNTRLDDVARTFNLGVGMHSNSHLGVSMAAMAHVAAAMPTVRYACDTHYPWMADDVIEEPIEFEDGCIELSDDPGLGVTIDEGELERMHELYEESDPLAYSSVSSMAAEYADGMADVGRADWLPNKPRW
ncbi:MULTISPECIES: enolase C-terminal domain-like protein [unclassified Haladaptatus]|uniref:enolase C-terminal domain-like protein n=1 Tax=unclassified Haladaptatus TaxID=2622732 RepID=UPI0023E825A2|nr:MULTISPECIES: enolase C-terminal domain-like protein [unclassified Haladaptatus]